MIDFSLSEQQKAFQKTARDFAQKESAPVALDYDRNPRFPEDFVRKAHAAGLSKLPVRSLGLDDHVGGPELRNFFLDGSAVHTHCTADIPDLSQVCQVLWIIKGWWRCRSIYFGSGSQEWL